MQPYQHPRQVPSLDGLRAFGLVVVIFTHLPVTGVSLYDALWHLNQSTRAGLILLDSFFTLSGFLITRLLLAERAVSGTISIRRFYARRALRILPIYYLTLAACVLIFRFGPAETAALATYTFNIYHPLVPTPNAMEHTWSLSVEEQFYLVWPFLIAILPLRLGALVTGRIIPGLALAAALTITATVPLRDNVMAGNLIYTLPVTRMVALSLGAWLAFREHERRPMPEGLMLGLMIAAVGALLLDKYGRDHGEIVSQGLYWTVALVAYAMTSVSLIGALVFGTGAITRSMQTVLSYAPLRAAGRMSYGGYLYHLPVLYFFGLNAAVADGGPQPIGRVGIAIAVTIVITILSARYIEAPLLAVKHRIRRTDPAQAAVRARTSAEPA